MKELLKYAEEKAEGSQSPKDFKSHRHLKLELIWV